MEPKQIISPDALDALASQLGIRELDDVLAEAQRLAMSKQDVLELISERKRDATKAVLSKKDDLGKPTYPNEQSREIAIRELCEQDEAYKASRLRLRDMETRATILKDRAEILRLRIEAGMVFHREVMSQPKRKAKIEKGASA